jgi:hypothetical protein
MMATYTEAGDKDTVKTFCDRRHTADSALIPSALATVAASCSIVIESFKMLAAQLKPFTLLVERDVHECGKWPNGLEYPVKRA